MMSLLWVSDSSSVKGEYEQCLPRLGPRRCVRLTAQGEHAAKASRGHLGDGDSELAQPVNSKLIICLKRFLNVTPHIGIFHRK